MRAASAAARNRGNIRVTKPTRTLSTPGLLGEKNRLPSIVGDHKLPNLLGWAHAWKGGANRGSGNSDKAQVHGGCSWVPPVPPPRPKIQRQLTFEEKMRRLELAEEKRLAEQR